MMRIIDNSKTWKNTVRYFLIAVAIVIVGIGNIPFGYVQAQEVAAIVFDEKKIQADNVESLYGLSRKNFQTETIYDLDDRDYIITDLIISTSNIVFDTNGMTDFVDVIGKIDAESYVNLSAFAEWNSEDINVASVYQGKIYARGKGETKVTVTYGDIIREIEVIVKEEIELLPQSKTTRASSTAYMRALDIYNQTWSPSSDIYQWSPTSESTSKKYFKSGTTYKGYPYTQYGDCYPTTFLNGKIFSSVLNNEKFLTLTTRISAKGTEVQCPYYGLDCSGLVCYALRTSQKYCTSDMISNIDSGVFTKIGSYDVASPSESDLEAAYELLAAGDALVKNGHCFLVMANSTSKKQVTVIEQTPPLTCVTVYSYSDLSDEKYRPFN